MDPVDGTAFWGARNVNPVMSGSINVTVQTPPANWVWTISAAIPGPVSDKIICSGRNMIRAAPDPGRSIAIRPSAHSTPSPASTAGSTMAAPSKCATASLPG